MKKELLFILSFILVVGIAIGASMIQKESKDVVADDPATDTPSTQTDVVVVPQLNTDERADSATMVLVGSPPVLPDDHATFWNPSLGYESCMVCHAVPETGAPLPTNNHYYDDDITKGIFRDYCIQCHVTQNDTKSAFNSNE